MKQPVPFTQAQVRRAVQAAKSAGLHVAGVTFCRDGSFRVETGETRFVPVDEPQKALAASWDDA